MIAETIGGYSPNATSDMRARYEKARATKPRCVSCGCKLAYDKANETSPTCEPCHRELRASGRTPEQLLNRQRGQAAARTRHSGGHKLPNLKKLREARALSKTALAERAGIDHHTVSNIELRNSLAAPATIAALSKALGVSEEELG